MILTLPKNFLGASPILFCPTCDVKTTHHIAIIVHDTKVYECTKCGSRVQIELEDENE